MLVVWKLGEELTLAGWIAKREARIVSRGNLRVADGTDDRLCAFEKLGAMTTHTSIVAGIIGNVGKVAHLFPVVGRDLVAGNAGSLMFFRSVKEPRIVDRGRAYSRSSFRQRPASLFLGRDADHKETDRPQEITA